MGEDLLRKYKLIHDIEMLRQRCLTIEEADAYMDVLSLIETGDYDYEE